MTLLGRYSKVDPRWRGPDGEYNHQVDWEEKGATTNVGSEEQDFHDLNEVHFFLVLLFVEILFKAKQL
jgi:hypothetical protein